MRREFVSGAEGAAPAVALVDPKFARNVGAALRTCAVFGMRQLWVSGERALKEWESAGRLPREERMRDYSEVDICLGDKFFDAFPGDVVPVAVEVLKSAEPLTMFEHPEKALYVFGSEDGGLRRVHLRHCHRFVSIPTTECLNLSVAVGVILYDRRAKRQRAGLEPLRQERRRDI